MSAANENRGKNKIRKTDKRFRFLSIAEKSNIVDLVNEGKKISFVAAQFGITRQAVSYIMKNQDKVKARYQTMKEQEVESSNPNLKGIEDKQFEKCIFQWCRQRRDRNEPICGSLIREKAKWFNEQLGGPAEFKASDGWLSRFKQRHGMRTLKMKGEKLSSDIVASEGFVTSLASFISENGFRWKFIYNADETGLAWKALPTNTLIMKMEKEAAGYKLPEDRLTVMVCTNATGTHKLPLQVIGKSTEPLCFKNINKLPVVYSSQESAWMDRGIFRTWFTEVFIPEVKSKTDNETDKILLILDNGPSHPDVGELNAIDPRIVVVYLPPNVTAVIQPMNQGVIENLKKAYRQRFLQKVLHASEEDSLTLKEFLKTWNASECCRILSNAWDSINETVVNNAWKKIGAPSTHSSYSTLGIVSVSEIMQVANLISPNSRFSERDIHDWIEEDNSCPVFRVLTDNEIVQNVDNYDILYEPQQQEVENGLENDNKNNIYLYEYKVEYPIPKSEEAIAACKTLFYWLAGQPNSDSHLFHYLSEIENFVEESTVINKVSNIK